MSYTSNIKSESDAFQRAAATHTSEPNAGSQPIEIMMRLAHEALNPTVRRWASKWLEAECNILVVTDETETASCAA